MSNRRNKGLPRRLTILIAIAGAAALGACSLDVENPTMIQDEDLTTIEAANALVAGVAGDFAEAMITPGGGGLITAGAMLNDELSHVGTWIGLRGLSDGQSYDDWVESQSRWAEPSQARWVAENAIERLTIIFQEEGENPEARPEMAEVTMWAGFASRALGDSFCQAVGLKNSETSGRHLSIECSSYLLVVQNGLEGISIVVAQTDSRIHAVVRIEVKEQDLTEESQTIAKLGEEELVRKVLARL